LVARHRLACGDSTDVAAIALLGGEHAAFCFTSPPYGQQRDYGAAKAQVSDWDKLMQGVFAAAPLTQDAQLLVNLGLIHDAGEWMPYWDGWLGWMREAGWRRFGLYVWDQGHGLPGDWAGRLAPSFEFIFHFNRVARQANKIVEKMPENVKAKTRGAGGLRNKDGKVPKIGNGLLFAGTHKIPDNVIRVTRHKGDIGDAGSHPAVFPVALAEMMLETYTAQGDVVFEPFCGSGSTIIAAERTGRRVLAMELDPAYCDVAVRRWQFFTGEKAVHAASGRTFDEVSHG
jgi:DNA modification methylase